MSNKVDFNPFTGKFDFTKPLNDHIEDKTNPHEVTLEQARTQDKTLDGEIEFTEVASVPEPGEGIISMGAINTNGFGEIEVTNSTGLKRVLGRDNVEIVRNGSGATIPAGTPVYISGQTGNTGEISPAQANDLSTMPATGITLRESNNNDFTPIMLSGLLTQIDTSSFSPGDVLYVSPDTAGGLTTTRPTHPNYAQAVAKVKVSGVGNGSMNVKVPPFEGGRESGTVENKFKIGDETSGIKTLAFDNGFYTELQANPTANRDITVPDKTGTLAMDDEVVKLTGDQAVAGIKTFSSSPVVPEPTTDLQAATKKYVDDNAGGGGASALDDLSDVNVTDPQENERIIYNGTSWVNTPAEDTGWLSADSLIDPDWSVQNFFGTIPASYRRQGNSVIVSINVEWEGTDPPSEGEGVLTIPEGFRPEQGVIRSGLCKDAKGVFDSGTEQWTTMMTISGSGRIQIYLSVKAADIQFLSFGFSYPVDSAFPS